MHEVCLHRHSSIEEAYHKALEIKEYLSSFNSDLIPSYLIVPRFSTNINMDPTSLLHPTNVLLMKDNRFVTKSKQCCFDIKE